MSCEKEYEIPVVLSKRVNDILYKLMVRTTYDNVYNEKGITLTEMIQYLKKLISGKVEQEEFDKLREEFNTFMDGAPDEFNTLMDIYYYMQNTDDKLDAMNKILNGKVDYVEYSKNNRKILNAINQIKRDIQSINTEMITTEEFERRIAVVEENIRRDMYKNLIASPELPEDIVENGFWFNTNV